MRKIFPLHLMAAVLSKTKNVFVILVFFFIANNIFAQQNNSLNKNLRLDFDSTNKWVQVYYQSPAKMSNMLVHICDNNSRTLFVDNVYQVQTYDKRIDVSGFGTGLYILYIKNDEGKYSKTINIK